MYNREPRITALVAEGEGFEPSNRFTDCFVSSEVV